MTQNTGRQSAGSGPGFMPDRKRVRLGIPPDDLRPVCDRPQSPEATHLTRRRARRDMSELPPVFLRVRVCVCVFADRF